MIDIQKALEYLLKEKYYGEFELEEGTNKHPLGCDFNQWLDHNHLNAEKDKKASVCDVCGTALIDNCLICGAPQCCPKCCKKATDELRNAEKGERCPVQNWIARCRSLTQ